ncbi:MAG: hypothetical protein ACKO32_10030 [Planctomycetia bacterium]
MQSAQSQLNEGRSQSASQSQSQAQSALSKAAQAAGQTRAPQTPEEKRAAEELAKEQERVRKALAELAERNRQRNAQSQPQSISGAQSSAQQAQQSFREGEMDEGEQSAEEARRQMEQAQRELSQEEEQYQRLRQEELLFRIAEEVRQMASEHQLQIDATLEVERAREGSERPSHTQRLRLKKIAKAESALAARAATIQKAITEEGSLVFAEVLEQLKVDLERIGRDLGEEGEYQSGERVQGLQQDVRDNLNWLAEALEKEKQRRREEPPEEQQQQDPNQPNSGQPPPPKLVPDVAELKLLRRMEVENQRAIEKFLKLHPELEGGNEADPLVLEDLQRLAWKHQRTTDLFGKFRKRLGLPDPQDENP